MNEQILGKAKEWANNPYFDVNSRQEIQKLLDQKDEKELTERFYKDLEFGTGGLRSIIGMGSNRINPYTIRRASQAVANSIKNSLKQETQKQSSPSPLRVCISYDTRHFSRKFAEEAASVFAANGLTPYLFKIPSPVALLSFSVRYLKAQAGVMITASHNPKNYNGYKAYWSDGAQVTPPYDNMIIDQYNNLTDFEKILFMPFDEGRKKGSIQEMPDEVVDQYFQQTEEKAINPQLCRERGKEIKLIYTPIHGTGLPYCQRAIEQLGGFQFQTVKEQIQPDPDFSTVPSPNPEDPRALALAVELLKKQKADLAMGTDPDTDRLGVVVRQEDDTHFLNGNQLGILLLHYILENLRTQNRLPAQPYVVKSIVTSELLTVLAEHYGARMENTLTGFKWICRKMLDLESEKNPPNFVFATEESFGYLSSPEVRDKDAINALTLTAEMALWYKVQGLTLMEGLDKIYEKFGFHHEALLSLDFPGKEGAEKIERIMEFFRQRQDPQLCGEKIQTIYDYQLQSVTDLRTQTKKALDIPKSNVLGVVFEKGNRFFLRPSGTEPKIKFYIMFQEKEGDLATKKRQAEAKAQNFINFIQESVRDL